MTEGNINRQPSSPDATTPVAGQEDAPTASEQGVRAFTQEDVNRLLAAERRTQEQRFAEAVSKASEFDKLAEKDKTELQRATERSDQLEKELASERASRLRMEVAQAKGLPAAMAGRLQGSTKEELEADAATFAELLPKQQAPNAFRDAQGKSGVPSGDWLRDNLASR